MVLKRKFFKIIWANKPSNQCANGKYNCWIFGPNCSDLRIGYCYIAHLCYAEISSTRKLFTVVSPRDELDPHSVHYSIEQNIEWIKRKDWFIKAWECGFIRTDYYSQLWIYIFVLLMLPYKRYNFIKCNQESANTLDLWEVASLWSPWPPCWRNQTRP